LPETLRQQPRRGLSGIGEFTAFLLVRSTGLRPRGDWLPRRRAIFPTRSLAKGFFRLEKLKSLFVAGKPVI
jgi:hypothetical protein